MTTVEDDEELFNGFVYVFKSQKQRIVSSGIKVFTCDVVFVKSEYNDLDGWDLYNMCSRDPTTNLVSLSTGLCPKENWEEYNQMFDKVMATKLTEQDHPTPRTFGEYLNSTDCLMLSDRYKGEHITPPPVWGSTVI